MYHNILCPKVGGGGGNAPPFQKVGGHSPPCPPVPMPMMYSVKFGEKMFFFFNKQLHAKSFKPKEKVNNFYLYLMKAIGSESKGHSNY